MIAKEFIVKLGFSIDENKFAKFNTMLNRIKNTKANAIVGIKNQLGAVDKLKSRFSSSPEVQAIRSKKADEADAYAKRIELLNNRIKNTNPNSENAQAKVNALLAEKKASFAAYTTYINDLENKERATVDQLEKHRIEERKKLNLDALQKIKVAARNVAIITAGIMGSFVYSAKNTLKDILDTKNAGKYDNKEVNTAKEFENSQKTFSKTLSALKAKVLVAILPALTKMLNAFTKWIEINKKLITSKLVDVISTVGTVLGVVASGALRIVEIFAYLIDKVVGVKYIFAGLIGIGVAAWLVSVASSIASVVSAFKALSLVIISNPLVILITAITAALVLLVDEIYVTIKGGDSLLNNFLNSPAWSAAVSYIQPVINAVKTLSDYISRTISNIKYMYEMWNGVSNKMSDDTRKKHLDFIKNANYTRMPTAISDEAQKLKKVEIIRAQNEQSVRNVKNEKTYNVTINAESTSDASEIATLVRREIEKYDDYTQQAAMNAVGVR